MQSSIIIFLTIFAACFIMWRRYKEIQLLETVTPRYRGEASERKTVLELLKMGIDNRAIFHDCYFRKPDGSYTQTDLVVATRQGLLAFEIKDYSGWIFGNYRQKYWTQVLAYGREKHRFYNPIMQNNGHIQAIRDNLRSNYNIPIYSIIVFHGNCTLKNITAASDNDFIIYRNEVRRTVQRILSRPEANFGNKYEIMNVLTEAVANGTNPSIVSAQLMSASMAGRNRPQSAYQYSYNTLTLLRRFRRF